MEAIMTVSKEKANEIQSIYEQKYAINDLCILLASNNELFDEHSKFYDQLVSDNKECLKVMEGFWYDCMQEHNISLNESEELYLDFITGEVKIRKIQ